MHAGSAEERSAALADAAEVRRLLGQNTQEVASFLKALNGEFVPAAAGGDLLRDGPGVLPTGAPLPPPPGNCKESFKNKLINVARLQVTVSFMHRVLSVYLSSLLYMLCCAVPRCRAPLPSTHSSWAHMHSSQ